MRISSFLKSEPQTGTIWRNMLCLTLLSMCFLQTGCEAQEPEDYVVEWKETREQLPEILAGAWQIQDNGEWTEYFTKDGRHVTVGADGDTIANRPYQLTDICGPFEVSHASEVEEKHLTLKLIEEETDAPHRCYVIRWYQVDEEKGVEELGMEFLSGPSPTQFI